jgi:hypothetical protein
VGGHNLARSALGLRGGERLPARPRRPGVGHNVTRNRPLGSRVTFKPLSDRNVTRNRLPALRVTF